MQQNQQFYIAQDDLASLSQDIKDFVIQQHRDKTDLDILNQIKDMLNCTKSKTMEERVIDISKGAFELHFGMSLNVFQSIHAKILAATPEKLI